MLPADLHVHTEWSWDGYRGDMERSCEVALEVGLPAIAFTDHAEWNTVHEGQHSVDIAGYHECIERCRAKFKNLRILSGVEFGEPHWFPEEAAKVRAAGPLDRVLGSIHCIRLGGEPVDASQFRKRPEADHGPAIQEYMAETLRMVESDQQFQILAHLDYFKRYWPASLPPYRPEDYEERFRAILTAARKRGTVLEINTTRGEDGGRRMCPDLTVLKWWHEVGGEAVSFGSDAHEPDKIAARFDLAQEMVEAAGFKPAPDPVAFWRR